VAEIVKSFGARQSGFQWCYCLSGAGGLTAPMRFDRPCWEESFGVDSTVICVKKLWLEVSLVPRTNSTPMVVWSWQMEGSVRSK
jgi:hypothetical protein